jgi:hypothetical protein
MLACIIARRGIKRRLEPELSGEEKALLQQSAAAIREIIDQTKESKGYLELYTS